MWQRILIRIVTVLLPIIIDELDKNPNVNFEKTGGGD